LLLCSIAALREVVGLLLKSKPYKQFEQKNIKYFSQRHGLALL
jgi:hypothetical protein